MCSGRPVAGPFKLPVGGVCSACTQGGMAQNAVTPITESGIFGLWCGSGGCVGVGVMRRRREILGVSLVIKRLDGGFLVGCVRFASFFVVSTSSTHKSAFISVAFGETPGVSPADRSALTRGVDWRCFRCRGPSGSNDPIGQPKK